MRRPSVAYFRICQGKPDDQPRQPRYEKTLTLLPGRNEVTLLLRPGIGSLDSGKSDITAFIIGPVAQYWVIPFMNGGAGSQTIGSWFGTGPERGMALIFVCAGIIGLIVTILAMQSGSYRALSKDYESALNA